MLIGLLENTFYNRYIVYMGVLNTALYYTKVCLGFSFKHTQVDIPKDFKPIKDGITRLREFIKEQEKLRHD